MPRRAFKRLQDEPEDIDTDLVDQIELADTSTTPLNANAQSPVSDRGGLLGSRNNAMQEGTPRRSMHQVDMDLEWPMIDIPQELREIQDGEEDFNTRSNSQANSIRVSKEMMKDE